MQEDKILSEQESLQLITDMIQKVKNSYHDKGVGPLLWGTVVAIASFVSYLQLQYNFTLPFDIWLIVLGAIIPQIILVNQDRKTQKIKRHEDEALNAVWMVYAITIFGLSFYQSFASSTSFYSMYILIYGFPTLVTGLVKKYWPMIIGAVISYALFMVSCFTETKYDFLLGAIAAIVCWFIPGIILRSEYLKQKHANV